MTDIKIGPPSLETIEKRMVALPTDTIMLWNYLAFDKGRQSYDEWRKSHEIPRGKQFFEGALKHIYDCVYDLFGVDATEELIIALLQACSDERQKRAKKAQKGQKIATGEESGDPYANIDFEHAAINLRELGELPQEIARCIAEGLSYKALAKELSIRFSNVAPMVRKLCNDIGLPFLWSKMQRSFLITETYHRFEKLAIAIDPNDPVFGFSLAEEKLAKAG